MHQTCRSARLRGAAARDQRSVARAYARRSRGAADTRPRSASADVRTTIVRRSRRHGRHRARELDAPMRPRSTESVCASSLNASAARRPMPTRVASVPSARGAEGALRAQRRRGGPRCRRSPRARAESVGDEAMTRSTSAVAVCCSSASVSSALRCSSSSNSRASRWRSRPGPRTSPAARSAASVNGRTSCDGRVSTPIACRPAAAAPPDRERRVRTVRCLLRRADVGELVRLGRDVVRRGSCAGRRRPAGRDAPRLSGVRSSARRRCGPSLRHHAQQSSPSTR